MCTWQDHSEKLKTLSGMKELAATEATMNIKYWPLLTQVFVHDSLFHRHVCKAIACIGRHVDNGRSGSGWPLFGLKYLLNWHREWGLAVNRVDSKWPSLYAHRTCYFRAVNLHCQNFFASLIFVVGWTYENILTPNFSQFTVFQCSN